MSCSLAFVNAPPENARSAAEAVDCTNEVTAPVADALLALAFATGTTLLVIAEHDLGSRKEGGTSAPPVVIVSTIAIGAIPTVVFAGSAVHGYTAVERCQNLAPARSPGADLDERRLR